ncbi:MAG: PQQ-binding-like beta-propeller repeat protein, partial [Saprospiraceae bacterium]
MATKHTRKLLVWAFCLHSLLVFSQATFQKTLGGPGNETATWVAEASNGFVIAGFVVGANGNQDALLIRLDASGNPIWQKRFGAGQADAFNCVVSTPDGGFLAAGETRSFGAGNSDILLVKVDEAGLVLWSKTIGDAPNDEIARCIIPTQEGGFVLSGHSIIQSDMAPSSVFLRLDASGNTIWSRTYKTGVGNLFLSNYIDGNIIYASGAADGDGAFVRIDLTSGNLLSTIAYSGTGAEALNYQQATQDGNLVIADHTWSANTGTDVELWVQKINRNNGQVLWSKVYYRPNDNIRGRIEKVNDGGFLLVPYDNFNSAQADAMLAKIDGNGNLLWSYNYGGNASDRLMKAKQTADGGFIAVGDTRSNSANGNSDILIIKTDGNGGINGSCPKGADIKSANFVAASNSLGTNTQGWAQTSTLTTAPLPLNLLSQVFSPNPVPVVTRTIPLCPNISFNIGGVPHFAPIMVVDTLENLSGSCDTIFHYDLTVSPFITAINVVGLCADETYTFNGVQYMAPATILDTIASSTGGCDTICSIVLKSWAQPAVQQTIEFCAGESVLIGGQLYSNPGTVEGSIPSLTGGCDTLVTYTLIERPQPVRATTITFCPGESVLIAGDVYDQAGTVLVNIPADLPGACDTLVIYTLELRPQPTLAETRSFCLGSSVTIAGQIYTQPGTVIANLASTTGACDTIVTYTLELLPQPTLAETRSFCPGEFVTIAGQTYTQPGTVIANLASTTGACDTIAIYTLELRPQPTLAETRSFCPGESVTIAGQTYTQPGTVIANLASTTGACETIVTYTLELLPQPTLAET